MQLPHVNSSSDVYLDYTEHFEGAGEAWIDAEILSKVQVKAVKDALVIVSGSATKLRGSADTSGAAGRTATRLRARYRVRDVILDQRILGAGDALLNGLCGRNHEHTTYRYVFDGGTAGDLTNAKMREEPKLAAQALERYNKVDDFPGKQAAGDLLGDAIKRSLEVRTKLDEAEKADNTAGDDELLARLEVRKALEQAYGILVAAFPGQRAFVESFFPKRERTGKAEPTASDAAAPPDPAPGGGAPAGG